MDVLYEVESLRYLTNEQDVFENLDRIQMDINPKELIKAIDYFLTHLESNHTLSGKQYETLSGIGNWAREGKDLTNKQLTYSLMTMADYFDQLSIL